MSDDRERDGPRKRRQPLDMTEFHMGGAIGESLRELYDDVAREPLPDRFLALIAELEAREAAGKPPRSKAGEAVQPNGEGASEKGQPSSSRES